MRKSWAREMLVTYDSPSNAAYVYMANKIKDGEVESTRQEELIVLVDRNKKGKVLGVEIIGLQL